MKKLLSLILIFSIIFNISNIAFASTAVSTDTTSEFDSYVDDSMKLLSAIGTVCNIDKEAATVTRAEFLTALVSSLNIDITVSDENTYFSDVESASNLNTAVKYALSSNIISSGNTFEPERPVTYAECYKMLVSALGYGEDASLKGGYPVGYLVMATSAKLTNGIENGQNETLNGYNFYILMKNFLEATVKVIDSLEVHNGETSISYVKEGSVLTNLYGWKKVEGIINGDKNTYLFDAGMTAEDVLIGSQEYRCNIPFTLGTYVKGYCKEFSGKDEVIYLETESHNKIVTINPKDIENITSSQIDATDEKLNTETYRLEGLYALIYNGKALSEAISNKHKIKTGSITLVDNNFNGKYDVCIVNDGQIMSVGNLNETAECIYDEKSSSFLDYSQAENVVVYNGDAKSSVSLIKKGDVLEYYVSEDKKYIEIHILNDRFEGVLTSKGTDTVFIDEKDYNYSDYLKENGFGLLKLGYNYFFVLTRQGDIACISSSVSGGATLAWVVGIGQGRGLNVDDVKIKLYSLTDGLVIYDVAEKVRINDESDRLSAREFCETYKQLGEFPIRYKLNSNRELSSLYIESTTNLGVFNPNTDSPDGLKRYNFTDYDSLEKRANIRRHSGLVYPHFMIDSSTQIITVAGAETVATEEERFAVGDMNMWTDNTSIIISNVRAYNVTEAGYAPLLVCIFGEGSVSELDDETSPHGIVESVTRAVDKNGNTAYKVNLCGASNEYRSLFIPDNSTLARKLFENGELVLKFGDLIIYTADSNQEMKDFRIDFTNGDKTLHFSHNNRLYWINYYYGTVNAYEGKSINVNAIAASSSNETASKFTFYCSKEYVWLVDSKTQKITAVTPDTIITKMHNPANADKVLVKASYMDTKEIIIYR